MSDCAHSDIKYTMNSEYLMNGNVMPCFLVFSIKAYKKDGSLNECLVLKNWLHCYKPLKVHLDEWEKDPHVPEKKSLKHFLYQTDKNINLPNNVCFKTFRNTISKSQIACNVDCMRW